ncbi:MAG: arylsulfatase [Phycisphaerales bacterium]|nr:MAG: arylsulfatase [Phycisphaerales bacterium]
MSHSAEILEPALKKCYKVHVPSTILIHLTETITMRQSRRRFLKDAGLTAATIATLPFDGCLRPGRRALSGRQKPNIIYILADDLGYGDLGCYGQERIGTPNLDRMAAEGMRFTQHYAGSTVCAPSRCALMTGKHTGHCTVRGNVDVLMKPTERTVAKTLKEAGYSTTCIGKWGIGHPPPPEDPHDNGFDHFFGYLSMWHAHNYYPDFLWRNREKVPLRNAVQHPDKHYKENQKNLVGLASEKVDYSHDLFSEAALKFIEEKDRPFFLFVSYTIPHANNEAGQFGEHGMEVPDYGIYRDKKWPEPEKGKAAMISRMDRDIGRILTMLRENRIDEETLVMFSSDNGPHKEGGVKPDFLGSSGPLRGTKRDLYEGGIRVPMIARWPGIVKAGSQCQHISAFWDILPTFAELAGTSAPAGIDGISMVPALLGKPQKQHEFLYWEFHEGSSKQAVRMGDWKAVRLAPSRPIELYDLKSDIGERNNVADAHPDVVTKVEEILGTVRTDADLWPLKDKGGTMPF